MVVYKDMTVILPIKVRAKNSNDFKNNLLEVIPGVVYGPKQEPISITVSRKEFEKTFKLAGESTVITLEGLAKPTDVLVKGVAFSPIKGGINHVDFYVLEKGKEIVTHVPLNFIGEAPVLKLGAVVNKVLHEVTVACQPANLPAHIDVDLSVLIDLDAKIHVSDLVTPKGVKITDAPETTVAVAEAIKETPEEVTEAATSAAEVSVIESTKAE